MSSKNTYKVNKIRQLIDLNGDKINFKLTFTVISLKKQPFYALVVNQATLDAGSELDYKHVTNGSITGEIVSDKNVYENYYLILKSDEPCDCDVKIDIKDIPPQRPQRPQQPQQPQRSLASMMPPSQPAPFLPPPPPPKAKSISETINPFNDMKINWKYVIIGVIIVVGGLGVYFYFKMSKKKNLYKTVDSYIPPKIRNEYSDDRSVASMSQESSKTSPIGSPAKKERSPDNSDLLRALNKVEPQSPY